MALFRWVGFGVGVVVAAILAKTGGLGAGLLLAAPLFGLCALIGVLAGELAMRPRHGLTRTASLEVRRIGVYLPHALGRTVATATGVLILLAVTTTAAGSPDDLNRAGRSLVRHCPPDMVESYGPWPGAFYTGRLAVVVLAGLVLAAVTLRAVVRRPRPADTRDTTDDDLARHRSAGVVTGATGILIAIPLAGVSLTAGAALRGISCAPTWWVIAGDALLVLAGAAVALAAWCLIAIVAPADRTSHLERTR